MADGNISYRTFYNKGTVEKVKRGRPSSGENKKIQRQITSDPLIEVFLREHPDYNASEIFRNAIFALMPKGDLRIRIDSLEREISDLKIKIKMKELELQELKNKIEFEEKIKLDIRLEEDCAAYYLRDLLLSKNIVVSKVSFGTYIEPKINKIKLKFRINFDDRGLVKESKFDQNSRLIIMPIDFYKRFKPQILDNETKEIVKKRMRPEYMSPPEVKIIEPQEGDEQ